MGRLSGAAKDAKRAGIKGDHTKQRAGAWKGSAPKLEENVN